MATMGPTTYSDDGTHLVATCLVEAIDHMHSGEKAFGKDLTSAVTWKDRMKTAGFINVQEIILKVELLSSIYLANRANDAYFCAAAPEPLA